MTKLIQEYLKITGTTYEEIKKNEEYKEIKIGKWKFNHRKEYKQGTLSKEKELALRKLGETFEDKNLSFEEMIELIQEHLKITGTTYEEIKLNEEYKEIKIGIWKTNRRQDYKQGKLSKEKELVLRELGETFEDKNLSFEEMIELIQEHLKITGTTYEEIKLNEEYKEIKIGIWKTNRRQDYKQGKLSKEKELVLRELGETFEDKNLSFEEMIELIQEYLKITGITYEEIKRNEEYKGIKLGQWKINRRKEYKQGILSKEKELALRELGETFEDKKNTLSFEEMIELIQKYLGITRKTYEEIKRNEEYKGIKLGQWKDSRRREYRKGILSKEKELALRKLGETFEEKRNILSFEEMLELIEEYLKTTEKKYKEIKQNDEYKGIKIGKWKTDRRQEYRKGKLSKERELALRSLGETFPNINRIPTESITLVKDANLTIPSKKR